LTKLQWLDVENTKVTDKGMKGLMMTGLQVRPIKSGGWEIFGAF